MSFAWPFALLAVALVPLLGAAMAGLAWWRRGRLGRMFAAGLMERILPATVRRRRTIRDVALLAGLAFAVVAVAEPRFAVPPRTVKARGTDIVVLLDLSRSMDARDVPPSRLVRARRELEDLQKVVEGDRIGLVIFAASAYARLPLTSDLRALGLVTAELSTDTFQNQGSDLGAAIDVGLELLSRTEDHAGKALLVLSDGETHHADKAVAAAERARSLGVPVFAMGIGVDSAPIPMRDGSVLEVGGEVVYTVPDFEILEQVAQTSGGAFVNSTASTQDLDALYGELRRVVTAVERETRQGDGHASAFQWPLGVAAGLVFFSAVLGDGRRTALAAVVFAAGLALAPSPAAAASLAEADAAYRAEDWPRAARELTELTRTTPGDPDLWGRLGAARYRAGDYEGAAQAWDAAVAEGAGADTAYNAGNAHYRAGRLEDAIERYDTALSEDGEHPGALANRDVVTQEIATRRAQKPPPPPKPDEGEKEGDGGEGEQDPNQAGGTDEGEDPNESKEGEGSDPDQPQQDEGQGGGEPGDPSGQGKGDGQKGDAPSPQGEGGSDGGEQGPPSDQDPNGQGGGGGIEGEPVPITKSQADRMVDGVEEGRPRTSVRGRPEDKPW